MPWGSTISSIILIENFSWIFESSWKTETSYLPDFYSIHFRKSSPILILIPKSVPKHLLPVIPNNSRVRELLEKLLNISFLYIKTKSEDGLLMQGNFAGNFTLFKLLFNANIFHNLSWTSAIIRATKQLWIS